MRTKTLFGVGGLVVPIPFWFCAVNGVIEGLVMKFVFPLIYSADHYKVRDFLILELTRLRQPVSPEHISQKLSIPTGRVKKILGKIGKMQMWIVRNQAGHVTWAYPVTVEETKFRVTYATGEQAWAP